MTTRRTVHDRDVDSLRIFIPLTALPQPDQQAGDRRFFALLKMLAERHRVDVWPGDQQHGSSEATARHSSALRSAGVNVLPGDWKSLTWALTSTQYHVGLFEFYHQAERFLPEFRRRQPSAKVLVDSVDIHFSREAAGAKLGLIDAEQANETFRRELKIYRESDGVIVVSESDADLLRAQNISSLFTVPLIIPLRERSKPEGESELLFVGGFNHLPNLDGLLWFMESVWPQVRRDAPQATLTVIGSNPPPAVLALRGTPGVTVEGYVADVTPYLDRAAISIAPLRYGAGVKGKVIEALACGMPVVTTAVGIQGVQVQPGTDLLVCDDAETFAEALVGLIRDPARAQRIGLAGQRVAELYTPEQVGRQVDVMLRTIVPNPRALGPRVRWLISVAAYASGVVKRRFEGQPRSIPRTPSTRS